MYKVYGDYLMHCSENALAHHGILGMHWGVKNGPPYPIDQAGKNDFESFKKFEKEAKKTILRNFPEANDNDIKFDRISANFKNRLRPQFVAESIVRSSKGPVHFFPGGDWNSDKQLIAVRVGTGDAYATVNTKIDGDYVNIAVYFKEGLIRQNAAEKVINRIKKQLSRD